MIGFVGAEAFRRQANKGDEPMKDYFVVALEMPDGQEQIAQFFPHLMGDKALSEAQREYDSRLASGDYARVRLLHVIEGRSHALRDSRPAEEPLGAWRKKQTPRLIKLVGDLCPDADGSTPEGLLKIAATLEAKRASGEVENWLRRQGRPENDIEEVLTDADVREFIGFTREQAGLQ
jgi:hypothetical protein